MSDCQRCELLRKIATDLCIERDEARAELDKSEAKLRLSIRDSIYWEEKAEELARYAKSYGEYHIEKFYNGDLEGIAAGPRKLIDLAKCILEPQP